MRSANAYVLRRIGLKLLVLAPIAALESVLWSGRAAASLFLMAAMIDVAAGVGLRESPTAPHLTYWDEAAAFVAIWAVVAF